jgi:hypothetical protein
MYCRRWLLPFLVLLPLLAQQGVSPEDRKRFEEIKARHDRGEQVSEEDRAFAMRIMRELNGQGNGAGNAQQKAANQQRNAEYAKAHPPHDSVGFVPLTELGTARYKGEEGGLYPGGANTPPAKHLAAGVKLAHQTVPLDADGNPSPEGKIVLLTTGMSNTTMESQSFIKLLSGDPDLNPHVLILDGAQNGQTAHIIAKPEANYWKVDEERLAQAGVTAKQVQAVWLKQANPQPVEPFPAEARKLEEDIRGDIRILTARFPNLKQVFLSSRIYAGYASTPLNPEPHAYESAFADKWLIAEQIDGKSDIKPWLAWGPYLWGDGVKPRKDGLIWTRDDLGADGTHPSNVGRVKVAKLLLEFFKSDPATKPWFVKGQ